MKFLVGIIGAVIFAVIAWPAISVLNIEIEWLRYAIFGIVGFIGFSVAQTIYGITKKK